jgi:hypothetical protein
LSVRDLFGIDTDSLHLLAAMFVYHLSVHVKPDGTPLVSGTINGYLTHVVSHLTDLGIIDKASDFRCPSTTRLVQAITLQEAIRLGPLRLRINIAVSLPIINLCIQTALGLFSCVITRMFVTAALYVGFAWSLRPDDYLNLNSTSLHWVRAMQIAFWFPDGFVSLCDTHLYPPVGTRPIRATFLGDFDKANSRGALPMRACAGNPNHTDPCFIQYLLEFFRRFPPTSPTSPLFSALPKHINLYASVNLVLKHTAPLIGVSPSQLVPKGLRHGATQNILSSGGTDADAKLTGGWRSNAHDVYKRANFAPSDRCAVAMHSTTAEDLTLLTYIHTTPAPPR